MKKSYLLVIILIVILAVILISVNQKIIKLAPPEEPALCHCDIGTKYLNYSQQEPKTVGGYTPCANRVQCNGECLVMVNHLSGQGQGSLVYGNCKT